MEFEVEANGYTFRSFSSGRRQYGNTNAVLFLHGFPSTSLMWAPILSKVSSNGFYCVCFDQRGYSPKARPESQSDYYYPKLISDVIAFADALGLQRFHLVTHDHGALLGWCTAGLFSDRLLSFTALSIPHIDVFSHAMKVDMEQAKSSAYMYKMVAQGSEEFMFQPLTQVLNERYASQGVPKYYLDDRSKIISSKEVLRKVSFMSDHTLPML